MYTLKINKIIPIFVFAIAMFSNAFADPEVDKALIDIVYDGIEGKKFVIQPEIIPPNEAVRKKALELEPEMVFADLKFIMNFLNQDSLIDLKKAQDNLNNIKKFDCPELYLIAITEPYAIIPEFIEKFGTSDIALLDSPDLLYFGDYIPTIDGFCIVPIKRSELTEEYLLNAITKFMEYINKLKEATASLDEDEELSGTHTYVNLSTSLFANVLAWNAMLLNNTYYSSTLYKISLEYSNNFSSILSLAALNKEGQLQENFSKFVQEKLVELTSEIKENSFMDNGVRLYFSGYVYGAEYFRELNWDWVIFGLPQNSKQAKEYFNNLPADLKEVFDNNRPSRTILPSKMLKEKLKKQNLPQKLKDYTPGNLFTLYSLLRYDQTESLNPGKENILSSIISNEKSAGNLKLRAKIEQAICDWSALAIKTYAEQYLDKYSYNIQVAAAALLGNSRIRDLDSQKKILERMIEEEGDKAPEWIMLVKTGIDAIFNNDPITFNNNTYAAIESYKGKDKIILGYLYNINAFSQLILGGINGKAEKKIDYISLEKSPDKGNLIHADWVYYMIGNNYLSVGDHENASEYLAIAYLKNNISQIYLNELIVALTENGEYDIGRDALKSHNENIQKLDFYSLDTLAVCIMRANPNDAKEALEFLLESEKICKEMGEEVQPEIVLHFAEVYNILDEKEKAKQYLDEFLKAKLERPLLKRDQEVLEQLKKDLIK
jgi:hypothetical protein